MNTKNKLENSLPEHIVQSKIWGEFKTKMKTPAYKAGGVQFTLHKIPFFNKYVAYAPKADLKSVNLESLKKKAGQLNTVFVRLDVPNVIKGPGDKDLIPKTLRKAPKDTFAKHNVLLDLLVSEDELLKNLKPKTRYNIRLAKKRGVRVKISNDIESFLKLNKETTKRQGFFIHPDAYYKTCFKTLQKEKKAYLLNGTYKGEVLVSYMLFYHKKVLYYPYGAWSGKHKDLMASNLVMWEAIKLGKKLNCKLFDMWGATDNQNDPWWGFTRFKLGYGGGMVEYVDSRDLVVNPLLYHLFNFTYKMFWALARLF